MIRKDRSEAKSLELLEAIRNAQSSFIIEKEPAKVCRLLLQTLIDITESECGFLNEICHDSDGKPYKKILAISGIRWDERRGELHHLLNDEEMRFVNLENLAGLPVLTGKTVISNDPQHDGRAKGLPAGHPEVHSFLGVPLFFGSEMVGVAGVANRKQGYNEETSEFLEPLFTACAGIIRSLKKEEFEREYETRLANLYKNMPGTAYQFRIDKTGGYHFDYIGENCIELFGIDEREVLRDANVMFSLIPRPDAEKVRKAMEHSAASLTQYNIEYRIVRKDGETLWIHASAIPRKLDDGSILFDGIGLNITDRKRIEEDLKESEERYRTLFLQNPNPIAIIDSNGNYLDANETYLDFVETSKEKLLTMNAFDYSPEGMKAQQQKEHEPVWKYGGTLQTEYLVNGHIKLLELNISPVSYGGIDAVIGVGKDITEQKRAENALRESEEKYRSMMESMSDATYICSSDFLVEYANPAMRERLGRDVEGERCYTAIHGLAEQCPWCVHDRVMKGESVKNELETGGGEVFFVSRSPVFHTNGTVSQLSVYRDITEMRKLERRVHQAQKMESIGNLAGGIAHDFNNILFPIIGMSELLLEDLPLQGLERENLEEILKAGKRGRDLVNQILAFSRQSEKKLMPIRVQSVLKEVLHLVRATIPSYVDIRRDIQTDAGMVMADPSQIHQVVMNIMTNAYHALAANGGEITVELKETTLGEPEAQEINLDPGSYVRLSISDTGHGIAADHMARIFDPYFTTKEQGKGTGLGLAVAYGIVKEHRGEIKAGSEIGKGSTFEVYLPLIDKPERQESAEMMTPHAGRGERLLVVDDEEPIAKLEEKMLERFGYQVATYVNSVDALEAFRVNPYSFDLIISDMSMPRMTGDEFAREVKLIRSDIPVIICTGFSERIDEAKARAIGVSGLLMKPFVQSEMAEKVRSALDNGTGL